MSGKKNKKYRKIIAAVVFIVASVCCFYAVSRHQDDAYTLKVIKAETGYGYIILNEQKVIIHQPFIPAVSKRQPFVSEKEAESVGRLIIERIKSGESYTITPSDLEDLKIHYK